MFRAGPRTPRTPLVSPRCDVQRPRVHNDRHTPPRRQKVSCAWPANAVHGSAETRDRTRDLQIFGLTLSQLSYRGSCVSRLKDIKFLRSGSHAKQALPSTARYSKGHGLQANGPGHGRIRASVSGRLFSGHDILACSARRHQACRDPGSNRGLSDLRSDALPAELSRLMPKK